MRFEELDSSVQGQLQLSREFTEQTISGPEFETAFLRARGANAGLTAVMADVLDQIFYAVDDYVATDSLRDPANGDLDDDQLREIVRTQLRRLDEA